MENLMAYFRTVFQNLKEFWKFQDVIKQKLAFGWDLNQVNTHCEISALPLIYSLRYKKFKSQFLHNYIHGITVDRGLQCCYFLPHPRSAANEHHFSPHSLIALRKYLTGMRNTDIQVYNAFLLIMSLHSQTSNTLTHLTFDLTHLSS
jgi:hypothetical protein